MNLVLVQCRYFVLFHHKQIYKKLSFFFNLERLKILSYVFTIETLVSVVSAYKILLMKNTLGFVGEVEVLMYKGATILLRLYRVALRNKRLPFETFPRV
jgi:hypothetical protein